MARTPKKLEPYDAAVVQILREAAEAAGMSGRGLAEQSGMGSNRVAIILRGDEPPATVGEVARLAMALGLRPSKVFAAAETAGVVAPLVDWELAANTTDEPTDREAWDAENEHDDPA